MFFTCGDKGKIQISKIMEYRATSGKPAHYLNFFCFHIVQVNFSQGILMLTNNNGRSIAPEHKTVALKMFQNIFFSGKIKIRISFLTYNTKHDEFFLSCKNILF